MKFFLFLPLYSLSISHCLLWVIFISLSSNLTIDLLLDCVLNHDLSPLLISSPIYRHVLRLWVCACLNQWFTFLLSYLSVCFNSPIQCFKHDVDIREAMHMRAASQNKRKPNKGENIMTVGTGFVTYVYLTHERQRQTNGHHEDWFKSYRETVIQRHIVHTF